MGALIQLVIHRPRDGAGQETDCTLGPQMAGRVVSSVCGYDRSSGVWSPYWTAWWLLSIAGGQDVAKLNLRGGDCGELLLRKIYSII